MEAVLPRPAFRGLDPEGQQVVSRSVRPRFGFLGRRELFPGDALESKESVVIVADVEPQGSFARGGVPPRRANPVSRHGCRPAPQYGKSEDTAIESFGAREIPDLNGNMMNSTRHGGLEP
jgi:hypothetical protein